MVAFFNKELFNYNISVRHDIRKEIIKMTIGFILALTFVCIVCRCIIFKKRDIKIIWGITHVKF